MVYFTFLAKVFHLLLFIAILFAITEFYNQLLRNQRHRLFHNFLRFLQFDYNTAKAKLKIIIPLTLTLQIHITASIFCKFNYLLHHCRLNQLDCHTHRSLNPAKLSGLFLPFPASLQSLSLSSSFLLFLSFFPINNN